MKIIALVMAALIPMQSLADCVFSKDIVKGTAPDLTYHYSPECHVLVGKDLKELDDRRQQVILLNKSLTDETNGYNLQAERAHTLLNDNIQLEKEADRKAEQSKFEKWLWFGLGILVMYGAERAATAK